MKTIYIGLVFMLFIKLAMAQQELLSFDEHNKYIYYQVVEVPGLPADTLRERGLSFLKIAFPKIKLKAEVNGNNMSGSGKFLTYNGISIIKHESGDIRYQLNIEFKDQKYRYWLTDFKFTPYERDRYGNFVPEPGIDIPLETAASKIDKKDADNYLNQTGAFCKQFGDTLKISILRIPEPKKEEITKKVVTDKW